MNPEPLSESTPKENISLKLPEGAWKETKPPKIRGALILVAVGLIVSIVDNLVDFSVAIAPIFRSPLWERYTNPGSPEYHAQWKLVIIYDAMMVTVILFWNIVMLAFFFRKKRVFPKLASASLPIIFLLIFASYYLGGLIPAVAESAGYAKEETALIIKFIGLHIWVPYFLLSKRVAKTFVC
ncbi:MAG TPA: DUF2569 domain-containing protein [Blastocatellia bacterium]|nr:DUF2569 domain-containing protein [Blastocatellia bacterium]